MGFALLAMFVQTIVSNKFIGHGIVIGIFVLQPILFNFGWENTLYLVGWHPPYIYSDMNGYGHFVPGIFWSITYWFSIFAVLGGHLHCVRAPRHGRFSGGAHAPGFARARRGLRRLAIVFLLAAVGSGRLVLLQRPRAERISDRQGPARHPGWIRARLQEVSSCFRSPRSPPSTPTSTFIPSARSFDGTGRFTLQNKIRRSRSLRSTSPTNSSPSRTSSSIGRSTW